FIVAYAEDDMPVVLGQDGARNLSTGAVTGDDPLLPYGAPNLRAEQLLRLAQFPHAGDLIVNSTLYEDGQVAAFEELVGSHGGLGGQQTEAFLLHPADMIVPQTSNATDIFALMDARRGIAGEPLRPRVVPKVNAWALRNLVAGMRQARIWGSRLVRALRIQRAVFREVADDSCATGQALITLLATLAITASVNAVVWPGEWTMLQKFGLSFVGGFVLWMLIALLAHLAGRLLRGKGDFTRTMRTLAFARVPYALIVLEFVPVAGPVLGFIVFLAALYAMWVALQEALELRPRVALLIPIVGAVLFIASVVLIELIVRGTALTIVTLLL
ncbi:MAG: YIP1 family protein, partial [Dehalococcoidia bacterium]|nr:YIP1 family protein [Dehalococcoidia bacterium]